MKDDQELAALARAFHQVDHALDKAQVLAALKEATGLSNRQIGTLVDIPRSTVDRYLRLLALPEDVTGAIRAGELGYRHWDAVNVRGVTQEERLALMRKARDERLSQRTVRRLAKSMAGTEEPDERAWLVEAPYDAKTTAILRRITVSIQELLNDPEALKRFPKTATPEELTAAMRAILALLPDEAIADLLAEARRMQAANEAAQAAV